MLASWAALDIAFRAEAASPENYSFPKEKPLRTGGTGDFLKIKKLVFSFKKDQSHQSGPALTQVFGRVHDLFSSASALQHALESFKVFA